MKETTVTADDHQSLHELAVAMSKLADAFNRSMDGDRRARRRWYVFVSAALVLILAVAIINYRSNQEAHKTGRTIADCTTPGGACYNREEQTQTAEIAAIVAGIRGQARVDVDQAVCDVVARLGRPQLCPAGTKPTNG